MVHPVASVLASSGDIPGGAIDVRAWARVAVIVALTALIVTDLVAFRRQEGEITLGATATRHQHEHHQPEVAP